MMKLHLPLLAILSGTILLLRVSEFDAAALAAPAPTPQATTQPVQVDENTADPTSRADATSIDPALESFLDELEHTGRELQSFSADVTYQIDEPALMSKSTRKGSLIYRIDPHTTGKAFAILFDTLIKSGRLQERDKHYIFADGWFVEIDHENRQFIKLQIVPPGQDFDPLALGEGPFPLPIGQKKSEVLARFDVETTTPPAKLLGVNIQDTRGLRLIPKPGLPVADDFAHVDIFYDSETNLPVGIIAVDAQIVDPAFPEERNRKIVTLENLVTNGPVDEAKLNIELPANRDDWNIDVRPWDDR